jgi:hypothetical protein
VNVWAWLQSGNKVWKVVSDYDAGSIRVYDETGEIIYERSGLSKEIISVIEANFLKIVASNLSDKKSEKDYSKESSASTLVDNPMYA